MNEENKNPNIPENQTPASSFFSAKSLVSFSSVIKTVIFILIAYGIYQLGHLLMLLFLSILLAITFCPIIASLEKKRVPKWVAFGGLATIILITFSLVILVLIPQLYDQLSSMPKLIATLKGEYIGKIHNIWFKTQLEGLLTHRMFNGDMPDNLVKFGSKVVSILVDLGILLVFTFYFMLDGKKSYSWIVAFFKDENREKINRTVREFNLVVVKYILGQFICSALVGIYVFSILTIFNIPLALSLSFMAAVLEVLPIVGFLASLLIIVMVTISVAPAKGIIIFGLFLIYHFFDAYVLIPKIYGNRMRLSGLVVLSSLLISIQLGGIIAGLLVLPTIAAYPIIERIWLKRYIGKRTVKEHQRADKIVKNSVPPSSL